MFDPKNTLVIANPSACGGWVGRHWDRTVTELRAVLGPVDVVRTERPRHATALAREAVWEGKDLLLSLGGDGTHSEVAAGIVKDTARPERITLGLLPVGTGGDFRRMVEGPGRLMEQARLLLRANPVEIDMGLLRYTNELGETREHHFLNEASFGMSGLVCRYVNASHKPLGGRATYYLASLAALRRQKPRVVRITIDGQSVGEFEAATVFLANGQYAGSGMRLAPEARLADGMLDVTVILGATTGQMLALTPRLYNGRIHESELVSHYRGMHVQVECIDDCDMPVEADGENLGTPPLEATVLYGAIRVLGIREEML